MKQVITKLATNNDGDMPNVSCSQFIEYLENKLWRARVYNGLERNFRSHFHEIV